MTGEDNRNSFHFAVPVALTMIVALIGVIADAGSAAAQAKAPCKEMRKVKLGVSVSPPNVVHTPIYVARDLGIFTTIASKRRSSSSKAARQPPTWPR